MQLSDGAKGAVKEVLSAFLRLCVKNGELPAVLMTVGEGEEGDGFGIYSVNPAITGAELVSFLRETADSIEAGQVTKTIVPCP